MIRDPMGELWAARSRGRSSSSLVVPYKHPATGSLVWLSPGQWMTLLWLRRRMKHGRGDTRLVHVAAATGAHPGTVTKRLDRLAQLGLLGRRSTRGRHGSTTYWPGRGQLGPRSWRPAGGNVATSTAYGGPIRAYVSRAGIARAARRGRPPDAHPPGGGVALDGDRGRSRRRPPRLIYERCPRDGGAARLVGWRFRRSSGRLVALWDGSCPRCGAVILAPLVLDVDVDRWAIPDRAADVLSTLPTGLQLTPGPARRRAVPAAIPAGPRLDRLRELAAEAIASGDIGADEAGKIGARWLGWRAERIPDLEAIAVDPADAAAARSDLWARARDHRAVRYSQPDDVDEVDPLSVRDSQPGPAMPDPSSTGG